MTVPTLTLFKTSTMRTDDVMGKNHYKEIKTILNHCRNNRGDQEIVSALSENRIYIYGAGNVGTAVCKLLHDAGIETEAFLDRNCNSGAMHLNKNIYQMDYLDAFTFNKNTDYIIISFIASLAEMKAIKNILNGKGFKNVIHFYDIYRLLITNRLALKSSSAFFVATDVLIDFDEIMDRVLMSSELWQDEISSKTYLDFVSVISSANPDLFSPMICQQQYFVKDIFFNKGYLRFIDCGAYEGDTAAALAANTATARAIVCFEPDPQNFINLCTAMRKQRVANEQILFPCGVWHRSEMVRFRSGTMSTSMISEIGDRYIQCVAIDDVVPDFKPTFIKMDVEGAEYEALRGARKTIKEVTPDLAISVYHRVEHMWEIPLLLKSEHADYAFYLRNHGRHGVETVMYATSL